jgi:DDE superfamily endonuclease
LTARADALFELTGAVLCADGPVRSLVDLTLVAEHRRGHGAMYDALNHGRVEPERILGLNPPGVSGGSIL